MTETKTIISVHLKAHVQCEFEDRSKEYGDPQTESFYEGKCCICIGFLNLFP